MDSIPYGFLGMQYMPEQEDYQDLLKKKNIVYQQREIRHVQTWIAPMEEVVYHNTQGKERYVYILYSGGADYSGQTCYCFESPVPDDQLADVIEHIRRERKEGL